MEGIRLGLVAIVAFLGLLALVTLLWVAGVIFSGEAKKATANFRGEVSATEMINANGAYRIAAYDHFFDLCASVQDTENTIRVLEAELDSGVSTARAEQVTGAITANRIKRGNQINRYNSDARKEGTSGQFRDSALPYQLDPNMEATTCAV